MRDWVARWKVILHGRGTKTQTEKRVVKARFSRMNADRRRDLLLRGGLCVGVFLLEKRSTRPAVSTSSLAGEERGN